MTMSAPRSLPAHFQLGAAISVIAREPGSIGTRIGDVVRVKPRRHYIFASDNERLRLSE